MQIQSRMHPRALQRLVHRVPRPVHSQSHQVQLLRRHGPDGGADSGADSGTVVAVVTGREEVGGKDGTGQGTAPLRIRRCPCPTRCPVHQGPWSAYGVAQRKERKAKDRRTGTEVSPIRARGLTQGRVPPAPPTCTQPRDR
ncbi:hypothetical protein GCM10010317_059500 [Streptomyces mirabilis]|nr:hypothetical protein GCM10010317_059500 [Streptomyces mirabilis]